MNEKVLDIIEEKEKQKKSFKDFLVDIFDIVAFLVFVLWIVLIIRIFLFNPYTVVWDSMSPTFEENDFIIVDKFSSHFGEYKRWDVVVFLPPGKEVNYIKRIVWMPGEVVKIEDGDVYICDENGSSCEQLEEDYLPEWETTPAPCDVKEFDVKEGHYLVFGDNRNQSTDARCCFGLGCYGESDYLLSDDDLLGKVSLRLFPDFTWH